MKHYKHILLPLDLSKSSYHTTEQALAIAQLSSAKITIVNFVTPLPASAYSAENLEMEDQTIHTAEEKIKKLTQKFALSNVDARVETAHAKTSICKYAQNIGADLIIIGSHGPHGALSNWLGSTVSSVANRAQCDVFIVRDAPQS